MIRRMHSRNVYIRSLGGDGARYPSSPAKPIRDTLRVRQADGNVMVRSLAMPYRAVAGRLGGNLHGLVHELDAECPCGHTAAIAATCDHGDMESRPVFTGSRRPARRPGVSRLSLMTPLTATPRSDARPAVARRWSQPVRRTARIGFLAEPPADEVMLRTVAEPFRAGLRALGYVEGQTVSIEFRWADGRHERLSALAAELLRLELYVLVAAFPAPRARGQGRNTNRPGGRNRRRRPGRHGARCNHGAPRRQRDRNKFVGHGTRRETLATAARPRACGTPSGDSHEPQCRSTRRYRSARARLGKVAGLSDPAIRGTRTGRFQGGVRGAGSGSRRWPRCAC